MRKYYPNFPPSRDYLYLNANTYKKLFVITDVDIQLLINGIILFILFCMIYFHSSYTSYSSYNNPKSLFSGGHSSELRSAL